MILNWSFWVCILYVCLICNVAHSLRSLGRKKWHNRLEACLSQKGRGILLPFNNTSLIWFKKWHHCLWQTAFVSVSRHQEREMGPDMKGDVAWEVITHCLTNGTPLHRALQMNVEWLPSEFYSARGISGLWSKFMVYSIINTNFCMCTHLLIQRHDPKVTKRQCIYYMHITDMDRPMCQFLEQCYNIINRIATIRLTKKLS